MEAIDQEAKYLSLNPDEASDGEEAKAIREAQEKLQDADVAERSNSRTQAQAKAVLADIHMRRTFVPKGKGRGSNGSQSASSPQGKGTKVCAKCGGPNWTRDHLFVVRHACRTAQWHPPSCAWYARRAIERGPWH